MSLLTVKDIHVTVGDRHLLRGVDLVVGDGQRIGLLGANGCGKSTLLRILAGALVQDRGERTVRRDLRLGYLPQEPDVPAELTILAAVTRGIAGRDEVLRDLERVHAALASEHDARKLDKLLQQQARLDERLEHVGGHDVDHRAEAVLHGLGMERFESQCGSLSGGERRRVALARLLVAQPDLLLLDEPTNHLDAEVTAWLEATLIDSGMPIVMVTHDRYFLDRLVDRIVEFDDGVLHEYDGNYRSYLVQRAERLEVEAKNESARLNTLRRETEWVRRGPPARTTKQKARIDRYQVLVDKAPAPALADLLFQIPDGPRLGDFVIRVKGASKSYGERTILLPFDLEIGPGERIGIVGRNGAGKTTMLRLCLGQTEPDTGSVAIGPTVKFAAIDQGRTALDTAKTVLQEVSGGNDYVTYGTRTVRVETFLEQFLFPGAMKHARIDSLSGGERNRVLIAKLLCAGGNVIVLDEPTNDLDLMSLRALEDALLAFPGTVFVVSHDRWFLDRIATRVVQLDGSGRVRLHAGDLSLLLEKMADEQAAAVAQAAMQAAATKLKVVAPTAAQKSKKLSSRDQKELTELPAQIEVAEQELARVDVRLSDPAIYSAAARAEYDQLTAKRQELPVRIARMYARWEALEASARSS
jgi:ATP-binding cassette subfamily F protein uup